MTPGVGLDNGSDHFDVTMLKTSGPSQSLELGSGNTDKMPLSVTHDVTTAGVSKFTSGLTTPVLYTQINGNQDRSPSNSQSAREGSPKSLTSESSQTPPATKRVVRGCKFEAGMAKARRRVPYSLGPEKLDPRLEETKKVIGTDNGRKLTKQMEDLYRRLLPTQESEDRRRRLVHKVEALLRRRWPGTEINVSVFGSSGNLLGTSESDVDICITTDCKELEHVCSIAELLDQNGMERVVCVSSAKVPIVKVWDPELEMACDMNVNNPIALENTEMIRSYVSIDHRFRPLAMVVKHWAKRRILNDAALGGTLSSYTWICMVLNFLQTRDPPILPSLQQKAGLEPVVLKGINVAFDKDTAAYSGFGAQNQLSLGELLFYFFRYYGYELDFEENALSVRLGQVIPKSQKAWHLLQDNRLCVEEPFNFSRNLANTADDTSMRGIHLELRRAFECVSGGTLESLCEQFVPGPEEHRLTETFIQPTARPIIPQAPAQHTSQSMRSNRNSYRGGRQNHRNGSNRRSSNPAGRNPHYLHDLPFAMTPQELQLQAQHQQHLLHDQLFQQYQYLQLQEQELRMQLYQQSLRQRGLVTPQSYSSTGSTGAGGRDSSLDSVGSMRAGVTARMPVSPALYQNRFHSSSPFLPTISPSNGVMTNPASPSLNNVIPDNRRFARRTSLSSNLPAGSLRAHSQPARSVSILGPFNTKRQGFETLADQSDAYSDRRSSIVSQAHLANSGYLANTGNAMGTLYDAGRRPEYMGYYVGQSPSLMAHSSSTTISPIPSHAGLAIQNGGLSPRLSSQNSKIPSTTTSPSTHNASLGDSLNGIASREPPNPGHAYSPEPRAGPVIADGSIYSSQKDADPRVGPLIVDGSIHSPKRRKPTVRTFAGAQEGFTISASTSDDPGLDTPSSSEDAYHSFGATAFPGGSVMVNIVDQLQSLSLSQDKQDRMHRVKENYSVSDIATDDGHITSGLATGPHPASINIPQGKFDLVDTRSGGATGKRRKQKNDRSPVTTHSSTIHPHQVLTSRTNGQDSLPQTPVSMEGASGWQTQKKKKKAKKPAKSEGGSVFGNGAGGETIPLDESQRKGG